MKKILSTFIILAMLIATIPMTASAITEGDWEFTILDNQAKITRYLGSDTNVVIPNTVYGVPVTSLNENINGDGIFNSYYNENNKNIISITIPSTVKEIPKRFVEGAANLEIVVLPEGLEKIGDSAFAYTKNLKKINLPSTLKHIGSCAFDNCVSLTGIEFPAGLEQLGENNLGVFANSGLTEVDLSMCTNLKFGSATFKNCSNLQKVNLPEGMEEIPYMMFGNCVSLTDIKLPSTVKKICVCAFEHCENLKQITLPAVLKEIEGKAFSYCYMLEEMIIPFGAENVSHAFLYCKNLKSLYIPSTVTKLSDTLIRDADNCRVFTPENSNAANHCKKYEISHLIDNSADTKINVLYNGKRISFHAYSQTPEIINGRTLVPLRSIFEAMGASVEWDGNTNTAIAKRNGTEMKIQIGVNTMYKNGTPISVDVPAQIMNGRTMVPARVVAEAFGADVDWDGNGRIVLITE